MRVHLLARPVNQATKLRRRPLTCLPLRQQLCSPVRNEQISLSCVNVVVSVKTGNIFSLQWPAPASNTRSVCISGHGRLRAPAYRASWPALISSPSLKRLICYYYCFSTVYKTVNFPSSARLYHLSRHCIHRQCLYKRTSNSSSSSNNNEMRALLKRTTLDARPD